MRQFIFSSDKHIARPNVPRLDQTTAVASPLGIPVVARHSIDRLNDSLGNGPRKVIG